MANPFSSLQKLFSSKSSKDVAKERLKLVLLHDRSDLSPALIDKIKDEIIEVLSKYVEIDRSAMDVELTRLNNEGGSQDGSSALIANIPIKSVRDSRRA
jgi:cell division topological specificity factor